jgi:hypothetical protein
MDVDMVMVVEDSDLWCLYCGSRLVRVFGWCPECAADRFALRKHAEPDWWLQHEQP